jgi:hypothetical protein
MSEPNYAGFWRRCFASLLDNPQAVQEQTA